MQLRTLCLLFSLFIGGLAKAQTSSVPYKRYQGLLWEITGKGTKRPSYLYGTMHVPEKLAYNLSDSFFVALRNCDYISLETDHDVWQEFTQQLRDDTEEFGFTEGSFYNENSGNGYGQYQGDLYGEYFKLEAPDTKLFGNILSYKPIMTNEFLYRSNGYTEDFEEDTYLDLFIFQAGKKLGKKVIGLETMEGSYEAVTRARIPDDKSPDENEGGAYIGPNAIRDAYRRQDLNCLDSLNTLTSPGKNFRKWMLEERNIIMANGIDSIAQMGANMFSAVGAAHLAGETGVIEMLRKRGYTLRPVQFSFDTDKKDMQDIEKLRFPVQLSTQWASDSLWSAKAPGKFYATSKFYAVDQSLCTDMSNGAYYACSRIKTNGLWTGQTPEFISTRIDSIIYERIPGKIQERKKLDGPFPGHDILTRTRRGDIQRYRIYITPAEVLVFNMGGNGDYVSGEEGTAFFNSIAINTDKILAKPMAKHIEIPGGNFKVDFPVVPFIQKTKPKKFSERFMVAGQETNPNDGYYFMTRVSYTDYAYIEEDTFELNIIGEKLAARFTKAKPKVIEEALHPYPSQRFSFRSDKDSSYYFCRLVIDGPQYYLLGCRNTTGKWPDAYFNSFVPVQGSVSEGWKEKNDTLGHFKVMLPAKAEREPGSTYKKLKEIGKEIAEKQAKLYSYGEDSDDFYRSYSTSFENETNGEAVEVSVFYFAPSVFPDADSLKRYLVNSTNIGKLFELRQSDLERRGDSMFVFTSLIADTNSNRGVLRKEFFTSERHYTISANINTDVPRSAFVEKVFQSFTPTDTSLRHPIVFNERDLAFLGGIYAADSLDRKQAIGELRRFGSNYKPEDFDQLSGLVNNKAFHKLKYYDRVSILNAVSMCKSPKSVAFFTQFYAQHPDSIRYRDRALQGLVNLKSKEGFAAFFGLLGQVETYIDPTTLDMVRYQLEDTLELAKKFVPELLDLAKYEHYNAFSLSIIGALYENGLIKPKTFKSLKNILLASEYNKLGATRHNEESVRDRPSGGYGYGGGYGGYNRYPNLGGGYNEYDNYGSGNRYSNYGRANSIDLLMPFYDDDQEVRNLFNAILEKGNNYSKMDVMARMVAKGKVPSNALLQPLAEQDQTRCRLYEALGREGLLDRYKPWFSDTIALARSFVLQYVPKEEIDSVVFMQKAKAVTFDKRPAMMYFFDVKRKKSTEWNLNYITLPLDFGVQPKNKDKKHSMYVASYYGDYGQNSVGRAFTVMIEPNLKNAEEKNAFINKKIGEIRFAGRARYRDERRNNYYGEY
jgi:uncharacterized protein YbaP (TraB family)